MITLKMISNSKYLWTNITS